jgi:diadenosine tetraphosphatase ApaH/serine/threonine PP2A family protein phosphatase
MMAPTEQPRRVAVLSDIHGNAVALQAVLADLDSLGIDHLAVAGDLVGFGPNPDDVVDVLVTRRAQLIRGNHEADYVAPYGTAQMPAWWLTDPRLASFRWSMDRLGAGRRAFLAALPDRLLLDEATLVVHGSPRHVRDAVRATTPDQELEAMFVGETARLAFVGHTHRPVVRALPRRRVVNVGSVGCPLDGDARASYAVATRAEECAPGAWDVVVRRVAYDLDAAVEAYDNGLREVDPCFVAIITRELRTGRDYLGPWLRLSEGLPEPELATALEQYLAAHP